MRKLLFLFFIALLSLSCRSVDDKKNYPPAGIVTERDRPVFIPEKEAPRVPPSGEQAVRESNRDGIVRPQDYSHAAMVYDYHPDWVYEIFTQPLRVCDIRLEPGELAVETPFISDSERWLLGAGVNYENGSSVQHIYVKPASQGLEATLIINTDRRVYHLILRSYRDVHMPIVRWRYPSTGMPNNYLSSPITGAAEPQSHEIPGLDPRFLSFNYRIKRGFAKPVWLPELVFDDGAKTYVTFPNMVLQRELPAVFENRRDIVNYRVNGNVIIIDKLIESITVKIERKEITIEKKRR